MSPLTRTIQTYLSLFNDAEKRERIPFMLDADLQETSASPCDTPRSKTDLKQKFPQLLSIIDRDLSENFNDKNDPLYSASPDKVRQRVARFHQRLLKQRNETQIMVITHGGWLSIELNGKEFGNGQIEQQIYKSPNDLASSSNKSKQSAFFFLFVHSILLYSKYFYEKI